MNAGTTKKSLTHSTDAELTEAIRKADQSAFKVLYYRYHEQLYCFLRRQVRSDEQAKDLSQEMFIRLWKNHKNLDCSQPIKAYLYRIAQNLVIDQHRKKTLIIDSTDDLLENEPSILPDDDFELRDKINYTIDALPEPQRLVFILSRFEGYKYAQIAKELNISVKTVESRMSKALKALREKLSSFLAIILYIHFFLEVI